MSPRGMVETNPKAQSEPPLPAHPAQPIPKGENKTLPAPRPSRDQQVPLRQDLNISRASLFQSKQHPAQRQVTIHWKISPARSRQTKGTEGYRRARSQLYPNLICPISKIMVRKGKLHRTGATKECTSGSCPISLSSWALSTPTNITSKKNNFTILSI